MSIYTSIDSSWLVICAAWEIGVATSFAEHSRLVTSPGLGASGATSPVWASGGSRLIHWVDAGVELRTGPR
jgi:hypothetical protein